MVNIFSASEIVETAIQIEKNGRDFYSTAASLSKSPNAKKIFEFLKGEEEKHITQFKDILSKVEKYKPSEAYPGEYFAYLKALSEGYVFTKGNKGDELANNIKTDLEAVELGIKFEKESILFYDEMKRFVLDAEKKIVDKLLEEEQKHLIMLFDLKKDL